jgi:hypothetical protein
MGGYLDLEGGELGRSISWRQRLLKRTSVESAAMIMGGGFV